MWEAEMTRGGLNRHPTAKATETPSGNFPGLSCPLILSKLLSADLVPLTTVPSAPPTWNRVHSLI